MLYDTAACFHRQHFLLHLYEEHLLKKRCRLSQNVIWHRHFGKNMHDRVNFVKHDQNCTNSKDVHGRKSKTLKKPRGYVFEIALQHILYY